MPRWPLRYAKSSALPAAPAQDHSLASWSLGRSLDQVRPGPLPDRSCYHVGPPTHWGGIHFRNLKLAGASNGPRFSEIDPARFSWLPSPNLREPYPGQNQQLHRSGREHTDKDDGDPRGYEGDGQYRVRPSAEVLLEAAK